MLTPQSVHFVLLTCSLLLLSLESRGSPQDYTSCPGGVCVPYYLCENGTIITNGDGLIDLRFRENHCPMDFVCCRDVVTEIPIAACAKTCVELYQCLDDVFDSGDNEKHESDKSYCPDDKICCGKVRQIETIRDDSPTQNCLGKCIPYNECYKKSLNSAENNGVDLRITDGNCNGHDLVCCLEPEITIPQLEPTKLCNGRCVPSYQCLNATTNSASYGMIDLRSQYEPCPGDLICCSEETISKSDCQGVCMPAAECSKISAEIIGKDKIDLRNGDNGCDREDFVCCDQLQPKPSQSSCDGTCVPESQCLNNERNLEYDSRMLDNPCLDNMICCSTIPKLDPPPCSCVHPHQCLDDINDNEHAKDLLDLRAHERQCPSQQICCKKIKPSRQENSNLPQTECRGTCVPFNQCQNGTFNTNGEGIIMPRSHNYCTGDLICCEDFPALPEIAEQEICDGKCVPVDQCLSDVSTNPFGFGLINLRRRSPNICRDNLICCKVKDTSQLIVDNELEYSNTCNGKCVPYAECDTAGKNSFDLRIYGDCPRNLVCCGLTPNPLLNPSLINPLIPAEIVCDGACVPLVQCADSPSEMMNHLIDLRFESNHNECTIGTICCNNPIQQTLEEQKWLHWIQDMNNMVETGIKNAGKCFLDIDRHTDRIRPDEIPWLTTVWRKRQYHQEGRYKYLCAGAFVRADVVLVTADCILAEPRDSLLVGIGNHDLKSAVGDKVFQTAKKVVHPDFNPASNVANIALLFLKERSEINHLACTFDINETFNDQTCLIVGWNNDNFENIRSTSVTPNKQPISILQSSDSYLHTLSTARNQSKQSCNRWRGATIICLDQKDQNWKIIGIAAKNNERCDANGIPETLVAIPQLSPWIREQLSPSFVQQPVDLGSSRQYLPPV